MRLYIQLKLTSVVIAERRIHANMHTSYGLRDSYTDNYDAEQSHGLLSLFFTATSQGALCALHSLILDEKHIIDGRRVSQE